MAKVSFNNKNAIFYSSLKTSVDEYFKENGLEKTGNWRLYIKAVILMGAALVLYPYLLLAPVGLAEGIVLSGLFGFVLAAIGFNVMHDACHGSYSRKAWVNNTLGLTLNALGGNAFIWKQKHNIIHHTYTNVDGIDDDIAKSPIMRQCSTQAWHPFHRFQHIYVLLVYAISSFAWVFIMDFSKYGSRRINNSALQKMSTGDHITFWVSKVLYVVFYIVLPIMLVGTQAWLIGFASMHVVMGFTLAIVFQLAHVVEETSFEYAGLDDKQIESEWAIHQLRTTTNFAPRNKVISWFVGGLNFQVEHHLFPRISHIHYPAISKIVAETCREHGLTYHVIPTMQAAVVSHLSFMRSLGRKPESMQTAS